MKNWLDRDNQIIFAVGAVAGVVITKLVATKKARELAVNGLAKGIILKDSILEEVTNIKEEAEDICHEAKATAKGVQE